MTISNYTKEEQERIKELATEVGFDADDPLFQIMTVLGNFEERMQEFPTQMEALLEAGALMMDKRLSDAAKAAEVMQHAVITSAVKDAVKQELPKIRPTISLPVEAPQIGKFKMGIWSIGGILGGIIAVGALLGSVTTWNVIANYVGIGNSDVTANDLKLLQWAKSKEGQQARLLTQDNKVELEVCKRDERLLDRCVVRIRKSK